MESIFQSNGIRTSTATITTFEEYALKSHLKDYIPQISEYPNDFKGRGIVFCAGGLKYFTCCWVAVNVLRESGCKLPIEIWYFNEELSAEMMNKFSEIENLCCKNIADYVESKVEGMIIKPLAVLYSAFEEVLFIDSDNICVSDPSFLFDDLNYIKTGTIFWPDYWETSIENPIWNILGIKYFKSPEQESGQILIHKAKCWKELNLTVYFNIMGKYYYKLLHGDKDTFKFAWLAFNTPYYMISTEVASCGLFISNHFEGNTMVQHDSLGKIIFLHRNLYKWDITNLNVKVWQIIRKFKSGTTQDKYYYLYNDKYVYFNIEGDTEDSFFQEVFPSLEITCLNYLRQLRSSSLYKNSRA